MHSYSSISLLESLFVFLIGCLSLIAGCSSLQSSVESIVTREEPPDATYAGRQHLPVTPDEAVESLIHIAPQQGWEVVSTGREYNTYGSPGTFFRMEPTQPNSGKQALSGIFYAEPSGSYVRVSEHNGLPEPLIEPLIVEIKGKVRE